MKDITFLKSLTALLLMAAAAVGSAQVIRYPGPTSSQTLALSADDGLLAVANPDNDTISLFDLRTGNGARVAEIRVGREPNGVALSPDGGQVYVANTVSGTVTVIAVDRTNFGATPVIATIPVGAEPYGLALTPSGGKLYVTNARSNSVSVIDTRTRTVLRTIANVGPEPRGIAITNGGGDESQETVYVTQFLALPIAGKLDGADDAKAGHVTIISAATDTITGEVILNPLADTGFNAAGDALARVAAPAAPVAADFKFVTGAYPNQLNGIVIRGRFAFVPNTGASPNGPTRFDVNTHSLLSVIDRTTRTDAGKTINMHRAVGAQTNPAKRFITQPWAIAFKNRADDGYVVSAASNIVVKVKIDPATGAATVQNDPTDTTRVLELATGKNPRGIVVNSTDTKAYVMNYVSRDVTVIDLTGTVERVVATLTSASQPARGTAEDAIHIGKELYFTSIGEFDPATAGGPAITGRMSNNGWGSCSACHPFGLTDNVVWIFGAGPRRTIPQHVDFVLGDPTSQRALNWSAIFDEEEDFELNIRGASGGRGLIVTADGDTPEPTVAAFTPANAGRRQLKVRGVNAWDAIRTYLVNGIRAPISPVSKTDPDVLAGRTLFTQSNCQNCHGGPQWSSSKARATAPPDPSLLSAAQLLAELRNVGSFNAAAANEVRNTAAPSLGAAGFNPPSLLSLFAFAQTFFHNGSVDTLDAVMQNVAHRSAGTGTDRLQSSNDRRQLIQFLLSIDAATVPIAPNAPGDLRSVSAASFAGSTVAPESIVSAFGSALATGTQATPTADLPVILAGTTLSLRDSAGVLRLAPLFYAGPGQINYLVPAATATGAVTATVYSASGTTASGTVQIANVAPGTFFLPPGNVAAATAIRVTPDGAQLAVVVYLCSVSGGVAACTAAPIDLGNDRVFLTLYGTGLRRRTSLANVRCTIGGVETEVLFAGPQGGFVGLDQMNVEVPGSLRGRGEAPIILTVDGQTTNPVTINVR